MRKLLVIYSLPVFHNRTFKHPLLLSHVSKAKKNVSISGKRQPFLYQYLKIALSSINIKLKENF